MVMMNKTVLNFSHHLCVKQVNSEFLLTSVRLCSVKRKICDFILKLKHVSSILLNNYEINEKD